MGVWKKITDWEGWPFALLYAPIAPYWVWITLKSKRVWFFTDSNPRITFGGLTGESKSQQYAILPKKYLPPTIVINKGTSWATLINKLQQSTLQYPFLAKLDFGEQGMCMRKIENETQLKNYHAQIPYHYLLQEFSPYTKEVSVFYTRIPNETKGKITGFLLKTPMYVIGDGLSNVSQLIDAHPKAAKYADAMKFYNEGKLNIIPANGEKYQVSFAGNHNKGAQFVDLKKYINQNLHNLFNEISVSNNEFFYGRYDIMCHSIEDLQQGKNFHILEYNGCGAEPNHFYDTGYTLLGAYREILKHWKILYKVCKLNKGLSEKKWTFIKGYKFIKYCQQSLKEMKALDLTLKI